MNIPPWTFGLIVTGQAEVNIAPAWLNREFSRRAYCLFEVVRRIGQLDPITSPARVACITGTNKRIPTKDQELGLVAAGYLKNGKRRFVLVIDDLEGTDPVPKFNRYRAALDGVLEAQGLADRASVHFFVNMVEAYFFADSRAVNGAAQRQVLTEDHPNDVESIRNPKATLRARWPQYHETEHGKVMATSMDLAHVLRKPDECCWLRALVAWCVDRLETAVAFYTPFDAQDYAIGNGCKADLTYQQRVSSPGASP